jgi:hypothetical protein
MRELTKSSISFSWVLSLFGLKQMTNLLTPGQPGQSHPATDAFNEVAQSAEQQLGQTLRAAYQAGDRLQRGFVDMMFGLVEWPFDPRAAGRWAPSAWRATPADPRGGDGAATARTDSSWRGSSAAQPGRAGCCSPSGGGGSSDWTAPPTQAAPADSGWGPVPPPGGWSSRLGPTERDDR